MDDEEGMGEEKYALQASTATGWLTQEDILGGNTLIDAHNEFNELIHL